jgi:hypothetical protein
MTLHPRRRFNRLTMLGLLVLVVANTASFWVQRHTAWPERVSDPLVGFLYGTAIAMTLVGIWRQGRGVERQDGCA